MTTQVEKTIEVDVPVNIAYNQWTQFADFPQFMSGVDEVRQISDSMTHWIAQIGGIRREWDAAILEQVPDSKIAWAATHRRHQRRRCVLPAAGLRADTGAAVI